MITARITALIIAASCATAIAAHAAETGSAESAPVGLYKLNNRSAFGPSENSRPPFWPIGHVKRVRTGQVVLDAGPRPKFAPDMFNVSSIVLGNPSLAIVNGRAYGEGEFLRTARVSKAAAAAATYRIRVTRIVDGQITLQSSEGETISVPLRRPELSERKVDEEAELLLQDR